MASIAPDTGPYTPIYSIGACGIPCIVTFVAFLLYFVVTMVGFIVFRHAYAIKSRSFYLILMQSSAALVLVVVLNAYEMTPVGTNCPSLWFFLLSHLAADVWIYAVFVRSLVLALKLKISNHLLAKATLDRKAGTTRALLQPEAGQHAPDHAAEETVRKLSFRSTGFLLKMREYLTDRYIFRFFGIYFFIVSVPILPIFFTIGDSSCYPNPAFGPDYTVLKIILFVFLTGGPTVAYMLRGYRDAHSIRSDLIITIAVSVPTFLLFMAWSMFPVLDQLRVAGWWSPSTFITLVGATSHTMSVVLPVFGVFRDWVRKTLLSAKDLELNHTSFEKLIVKKEPKLWGEFREYAAADFCVENILFMEEIDNLHAATAKILKADAVPKQTHGPLLQPDLSGLSRALRETAARGSPTNLGGFPPPVWRQQLTSTKDDGAPAPAVPVELRQRWKQIFDDFIADSGTSQLNVPFNMTKKVSYAIKAESFGCDVYDAIREEVLRMLYENTFSKFVLRRQAGMPLGGGTSTDALNTKASRTALSNIKSSARHTNTIDFSGA